MESNQIIEELKARGAEAHRAAVALAEGLAAIAEPALASESSVRSLLCPQCWAPVSHPCTITGPDGDHLARYVDAERRGLITRPS